MSRATGQDALAAQASLRESEARFRSIFENAAVGMAHLSKDGAWLEMNQRICNMLGYTRDELQQLTFQDITHPDDLDLDLSLMQEVLQDERESYEMEKRYIRKDGSVVWARLTVGCVRKPDRSVDYFISVLQDVSEKHKTDNALRQSETRFWSTFENAAVGIVHVGLDGSWLRMNEKVCQILGYTNDELLELDFRQLSHPDDLDLSVGAMREMVAGTRDSFRMEKRYVRKDGSTIWATLTSATVRDDEGNVEYLISVIEDISAQRRMHQSLIESEARFRAVQQTTPDGFMLYKTIRDPHGEIEDFECYFANPAAHDIASFKGQPYVGRWLIRDTPPQARVGFGEVLRRVVETNVAEQGETRLLEPGEERWARYSIVKVDDGVAISFSDITDRIRTEIALRESEARFRAVQQTTPDGFLICSSVRDEQEKISEFKIEYANPAAKGFYADPSRGVTGETMRNLTPAFATSEMFQRYVDVVETGKTWQGETLYLRHDRNIWFRVTATKVGDGFAVSFADITRAKQTEFLLNERDHRLRTILNNVVAFVGLLTVDGVILEVNETALMSAGIERADVIGKFYWDSYWISHDVEAQERVKHAISRAAKGELVRYDTRIRTAGDNRATVDFQLAPIFDKDGNVVEIVPSAVDISDRVQAEGSREMLVRELSHRVKNSLATVQTIASHTLRDAKDLDSFRDAFVGRLMAISKCHDLLVDPGREAALLSQLVRDQVLPYARAGAESQVFMRGPALVLGPEASHTFGLILHELATNAAKYGALSDENGKLRISWQRSSDPSGSDAIVTWEETGGPPVSPPTRRGFGSVLIEQSLVYSLGGKAELEYRPEGFWARFRFSKMG